MYYIHYVGYEDFNVCQSVNAPVKLDDKTDWEQDAEIILQSNRLDQINEVYNYEKISQRDVLI